MVLRYFAGGFLIGMLSGIVIGFAFPMFLMSVVEFKSQFLPVRSFLGQFTIGQGSLYNVIPILSIYLGVLGGLIGFVIGKLKQKSNPPETTA